ncbi:MAG: glycosyltransferase family 4 protein [Lachnospiraceae bacterium]|nr:glycosyltransferase family 4 protein [Lachnospiraceae bacterium]
MNVLCLFQKFDFSSATIYLDLVCALRDRGHRVMISACTAEDSVYRIEDKEGIECAFVPVPDQFKAGKIKKGLIQLTLGRKLLKGVKRYFWDRQVDIIIYPTPPVTLSGILKPLKRHYGAVNYLMLKDIFPQNAVDLKMMGEGGLLHRLFRRMEKELYRESDVIGCMSEANVEYIAGHEPEVDRGKLELFPNTVKILPEEAAAEKDDRNYVNFFFGGNLGKPQAVDFLLDCIAGLKDYPQAVFTFIGSGTEEGRVRSFIEKNDPPNLKLLKELPRREYEKILKEADIGIVALSHLFTIPNFPSRILSYMQMSKPVFAVTDRKTDMGAMITEKAHCGYWCPSDDKEAFTAAVKRIVSEKDGLPQLGRNGREYLIDHFDVERSVDILESAVKRNGRSNTPCRGG